MPFSLATDGSSKTSRNHRMPYLVRERLPFFFVLLAVAFHAMPEDLVEEDRRGASVEDGRSGVRLDDRGSPECPQIGDDPFHEPEHDLVAREPCGVRDVHRLDALEPHAVVGDRARGYLDPAVQAGDLDARAFAAREVAGLGGRLEPHPGLEELRVFRERRGQTADARFPAGPVHRERCRRLVIARRALGREIVRRVFFRDLDLKVRLHANEVLHGALVLGVRGEPRDAANRSRVVLDGEKRLSREVARHVVVAAQTVSVVELVGADPYVHIETARAVVGRADERTERALHFDGVVVRRFVRNEVRHRVPLLRLAELTRVAGELFGEHGQERRGAVSAGGSGTDHLEALRCGREHDGRTGRGRRGLRWSASKR
jgi:hypothetical protein